MSDASVPGQAAVWTRHAGQWSRVGVPLRPGEEDCRHFADLLFPSLRDGSSAAILGVTPELVQLPWPAGVQLHAFDHSQAMVDALWAPNPRVQSHVHVTRWETLPRADSSLDVAAGDNSLGVLPSLVDQHAVLRSLARVLRADGRLVLRYFVRPDRAESSDAVVADALAGRLDSFHALKWRVAMLLSEGRDFSVAVADIHALFNRLFPNRAQLSRAGGWPLELIGTIDAYAGAPTRYTFPTLPAALDTAQQWFDVVEVRYGTYELAGCCPIVAFRRRGEGGAA